MQSKLNTTYAQIVNGKCHWVFTSAELPEWNEDHIEVVEILGDPPPIGAPFNGESFDPLPPPPVVVPKMVTMRQARRALLDANLYANVQGAIAAIPGVAGDAARIDWEFASTVNRDDPLVTALAGALSLTEADLDDLFIAAGAIV